MTTFPFQWYNLMSLLCTPYTLGCFLFEWRVIHLRDCCSGVYSDEHLNDTRVRPWFATAYLYNEPLYRDQSTRHDLVCLTHCDQRAFSNTFSTCPEWSYRVLHTLDVVADNSLTGHFRLARPHWNNMARLSCHAKYPNPLQMYGWVICFEINCTWKQMSHRVMFAYRCWSEI